MACSRAGSGSTPAASGLATLIRCHLRSRLSGSLCPTADHVALMTRENAKAENGAAGEGNTAVPLSIGTVTVVIGPVLNAIPATVCRVCRGKYAKDLFPRSLTSARKNVVWNTRHTRHAPPMRCSLSQFRVPGTGDCPARIRHSGPHPEMRGGRGMGSLSGPAAQWRGGLDRTFE